MALQVIKTLFKRTDIYRNASVYSASQKLFNTDSTLQKDLWVVQPTDVNNPEKNKVVDRSNDTLIAVPAETKITPVNGVPEEHISGRRVRIYQVSKNSMQSGTDNVGVWQLDFEARERWENPLMGWTSTGDPLSNMKVQFTSSEDAIHFAKKNGWEWFLDAGVPVKPKVKSYGFNFSWNKRSRVSTK